MIAHATGQRGASRRAQELAFRTRLIVEAAEGVFATRGLQAASVEDIAARAEVAIATLYKLFGSKDAIFTKLVEHRQQEFLLEVAPVLSSDAAPAVRLSRFIEVVFRYFESHRDAFRIYIGTTQGFPWQIRSSLGEHAFAKYQEFVEFVAGLLATGMRGGVWRRDDPTRLAVAIMGVLNGLLLQWQTQSVDTPADEHIRHATELVFRLVGTSAAAAAGETPARPGRRRPK
jgi:AcrR family transcriptional regulator